jgi:hypothetical protein
MQEFMDSSGFNRTGL